MSDLPKETARDVVAKLEAQTEAINVGMSQLYDRQVRFKNRFAVTMFSSCSNMRAYLPLGVAGVTYLSKDFSEKWKALACGGGVTQPLLHEVTHQLMLAYGGMQPHWLTEGLASYFQTVKVDGNTIVLGTPLSQFGDNDKYSKGAAFDFEQLITLSKKERRRLTRRTFYFESWKAVHMLFSDRLLLPQFKKYVKKLNAVAPNAWETTIGTIPEINSRYKMYHTKRDFVIRTTTLDLPQGTIDQKSLGNGQLHDRLLELSLLFGGKNFSWRLREALSENPMWARAKYWRALYQVHVKDNHKAALAEVAEDEYAFTRIGIALDGGITSRVPCGEQRALESRAKTAVEWGLLASHYLASNMNERAYETVRKSLEIDTACLVCLRVGARVAASLGRFEEAAIVQRRLVARRGHAVSDRDIAALEEYENEKIPKVPLSRCEDS